MSLATNPRKRLTLLCALYVAQGIPWGFMDITMVNYLIDQGITPGAAAEVAAWILLPWAFKLIWAPLIDTVTIRSMGRRRPWIIGAQTLMAITLLGILAVPDVTQDLRLLGMMFFIHNIFASLQDVSTDALAVDILKPEEQGRANGMMWASKLVGYGAGGALFAQVIHLQNIETAIALQIVMLGIIMILPMMWVEREGERRFPWSPGQAQGDNASDFVSPAVVGKNMWRAFSLRTTAIFLIFTVCHNFGPEIGKFMGKGVCTGRLQWSHVDLSNTRGLAISTELAGALLGGVLSAIWGRRPIILIGMLSYAALNILAASAFHLWDTAWFPYVYLILSPGLIAIGAVGFLSMSMRISWTAASATVFTTYMAVSNVSAVIGKRLVKPIEDSYSYETGFYLAAFASLIPLLLLPLVSVRQVDQAAEEADAVESDGDPPAKKAD